MNLSNWQGYSQEQKKEILGDIATVVMNGEMPLAQYTLIHRSAKLSTAEAEAIYAWARAERRRLNNGAGSLSSHVTAQMHR